MASSQDTRGVDINIPESSDSDVDYSAQAKLPVLTRHNWYEWKAEFENLLTSKGHEEILDPKWVRDNLDSKRFRKKTAVAIQLLFGSVDRKLKGYVTPHQKDFAQAFQELKKACGEDLLIVIGDQVSQLVYLLYQPNSLIRENAVAFREQ